MEDDKHMRLIVPGLEAEDLQITAMPDSIIVQAEALSKESSTAESITRGSHLLFGSNAEKVVRLSPCPVLTVKHPEHILSASEPLILKAP